jgi:hypothetical protein
MIKRILIFNIALMSVILLNQTAMNLYNFHSLINNEYLVDSTIQVVEENHEEDSFTTDNLSPHNLAAYHVLACTQGPSALTGIPHSVWQPPE